MERNEEKEALLRQKNKEQVKEIFDAEERKLLDDLDLDF